MSHFFHAKDLADIARQIDRMAAYQRKLTTAEKGHARLRAEGQAYAFEQAARLLREVKWTDDIAKDANAGLTAPYAIPRDS